MEAPSEALTPSEVNAPFLSKRRVKDVIGDHFSLSAKLKVA
jgi:hypothetical protein